jgi:hypothetical protein
VQLAVGELIAERGAFAGDVGERALDALAFGTGLGGVAELARQRAALGEGRVKVALAGVQGARSRPARAGGGVVVGSARAAACSCNSASAGVRVAVSWSSARPAAGSCSIARSSSSRSSMRRAVRARSSSRPAGRWSSGANSLRWVVVSSWMSRWVWPRARESAV